MDFKTLKEKNRVPVVWRLLPNDCDFQKENHGFKNLHISFPMDFYSL
jgi:hypothetical protein